MGLFDRFRRKKPKTEEKSWTLAGYPLACYGRLVAIGFRMELLAAW